MFKNLTLYRLGANAANDMSPTALEAGLQKSPFIACGATQPLASGWTPPRGASGAPLVESIGGHWLLQLMTEQKVLPSSVVKRRTDEVAAQVERQSGRLPGKKEKKEIKEQVVLELLPMAFTKRSATTVWIDPEARLLVVDTASASRADEVVTQLVKATDGLVVAPLHTAESPAAVMSAWLVDSEPPAAFSVDRECELKSSDEMKSVVRYARHALDIEEVRQHIAAGKRPTQLALTWGGRVSFVLTETMQVRKIAFLDVVFEGGRSPAKDEAFEADAAIGTGELRRLIPDLIEALGGEKPLASSGADRPPAASDVERPPAVAEPERPAASEEVRALAV